MSAVTSAVLYVELGHASARQRTILRLVLLSKRWRPVADQELTFLMEVRGARSDQQVLDRATQNIHAAVAAAELSDWSADCILADGPLRDRLCVPSERR